ncbi:MAG: DNA recombination protein RmuC [Mycobacteriaceae bacterium]
MSTVVVIALIGALTVGVALGWFAHASYSGERAVRAEAQLAALRHNETLLTQSLSAVNEDAARRASGAIGEQIASIVGPLRETVGSLAAQVDHVERNRIHAYAGLQEQVAGMHRTSQSLSTQTGQLVTALRAPQVRGRWGEVQLERVVELSGMSKHCDFSTQQSGESAEGVQSSLVRPDLLVHLAGGKNIVVDAKVPFAAYLDAVEQTEEPAKTTALKRHASQVRTHITTLSAKSYWLSFDQTPEFVVLFLPGDSFLDAALQMDPELLEYGFSRNVVLATPTTLIALLRTVAHMWRSESLSQDAATIHQLGRELYARIGTVSSHLDKLGSQLSRAVDSFNSTVASVESRVNVTARKLHELKISEVAPTTIRQVELRPRAVIGGDTNDVLEPSSSPG